MFQVSDCNFLLAAGVLADVYSAFAHMMGSKMVSLKGWGWGH